MPDSAEPARLRERLGGEATDVAPLLLGALIRHAGVTIRLTEVEAYAGDEDPGSHAYRGPTPRTEVMFGPAGHAYVYFTYGMHHCANVVCGPTGRAAAVLLRAGEVVGGVEVARERRGRPVADRELARGPAVLCRALALTTADSGLDLLAPGHLRLPQRAAGAVSVGPRVGLREAADRPWRYWLTGEATVSTYRPATARPRRTPR